MAAKLTKIEGIGPSATREYLYQVQMQMREAMSRHAQGTPERLDLIMAIAYLERALRVATTWDPAEGHGSLPPGMF